MRIKRITLNMAECLGSSHLGFLVKGFRKNHFYLCSGSLWFVLHCIDWFLLIALRFKAILSDMWRGLPHLQGSEVRTPKRGQDIRLFWSHARLAHVRYTCETPKVLNRTSKTKGCGRPRGKVIDRSKRHFPTRGSGSRQSSKQVQHMHPIVVDKPRVQVWLQETAGTVLVRRMG